MGKADLAVAAWYCEAAGLSPGSVAESGRAAELFAQLAATFADNVVVLASCLRAAARCFERANRGDEAVAALHRLVDAIPSDVEAWKGLARLHVKRDDAVSAFESFAKALEHGPESFTDEFMVPLVLSFAASAQQAGHILATIEKASISSGAYAMAVASLDMLWPPFGRLCPAARERVAFSFSIATNDTLASALGPRRWERRRASSVKH